MVKLNLTVQLEESVIHRAKVVAAKRGTSVSTLVARELERLVTDDERYEQAWQRARAAHARATPPSGRQWARDGLHER
jgi:hypothetical protein